MIDRRNWLGASDVAALMDESPYSSRYKLWAEKAGLIEPEPWDAPTSERMQIGKDLEKPILEIWAKRMGLTVLHNDRFYPSGHIAGFGATPDGFVMRSDWSGQIVAPVDAKTVQPRERKQWLLTGTPRHYWWQVQGQTLTVGADYGYLVALFGVSEIAHEKIAADKEAHERIRVEVDLFWKQVRGEAEPPPADAHKATTEALMKQERSGEPKMLDGETWELAAAMAEWQKEQAALEKKIRQAKNTILQAMGDSPVGMFSSGDGFRITTVNVKEQHRAAYSYQKFASFAGKDAEQGEEE